MKSWSPWKNNNKSESAKRSGPARRRALACLLCGALCGLAACTPAPRKVSELAQMKYLQAMGKHKEAVRDLKVYLAKYPRTPYSPEVAYLIGESYLLMNDLDEAYEAYDKVAHDYPKSPYGALGWRRMGELEQKKGNFEEAIDKYRTSIKINSADFNKERCTLYIAKVYENDLKDLDSALAEYKKLLYKLKNPRIASAAHLAAAKIYAAKKETTEAQKILTVLLEDYSESAEAEEAKKLLESIKQ